MSRTLSRRVSGLALCCAAGWAAAQTPPVVLPKTADMTPAERAQRDADKVFHWIRLSGEKTVVKSAPPAAAAAPAAKPVTRSVAAAAAPVGRPTPETAAPAVAMAPAVETPPPPTLIAAAAPTLLDKPSPLPPAAKAPEPEPLPDLPLKLVNRVEPEIPRQLMATMRSGSVVVNFVVAPDGSVQEANVKQPGDRKLAAVAIKAVSQWRFEPIAKAREATVELGFQLE